MKHLMELVLEACKCEEEEEVSASKIKELEKKVDNAEEEAKKAKKRADDAEEKADEADKEANKAEESITDEKGFRDYAENKFKEVFGDKLDKDKMNSVVDGILKKYKDEAEAGDWGTIVGVLNKSFGK